ncbi:MAG: RNA polymerase sigma factor [Planctomycetes bacterium]|nr:RNA polymerase sigma factor [Planctomycetota bacterium]
MDADARKPELDELLAHSAWAWTLARRLVRDGESADDVVQEAWVRALQRPPSFASPEASPRPWLATVMRNALTQWRRSDARRVGREQAAARPEALPAVDRALAREQARRGLVDAVLSLDEPYRSTLLLRYFDELSPAAIAKREGVPASTVRNRVSRGLELLRARLRGTRAADGRDALSALAPFALSRLPWNLIPIGLLAMKKFHVAWVAVIALCGVDGGAWYASRLAPLEVEAGVSPEAQVAPVAQPSESAPPMSERSPVASEASVAAAAPTGHLLRVLDGVTRAPVAGATVVYASRASISSGWARFAPPLSGDVERDLEAVGTRATSDQHGELRIPEPPETLVVVARADCSWGQTSVDPRATGPTEVLLEDDVTLHARVVDERGEPVAGVPLAISRISDTGRAGDLETWPTDAAGRAEIPHAQMRGQSRRGELMVHFGFPSSTPGVRVDLSRPEKVLELTLPATGSLRVRLLDGDGKPLTGRYRVDASIADVRSDTERRVGGDIEVVGSEGVFPFVDLGRQIGATAWPGDLAETDACTGVGAGPRQPGEEAILELRRPPGPRDCIIAVQDHDGTVLAKSRLAYELIDSLQVPLEALTEVVTDDQGSFTIPRGRSGAFRGRAAFVRVVRRGADGTIEQEVRERLALLEPSRRGRSYVRLGPSRVLAAGCVLSPSGAPCAGASVVLYRRKPPPDAEARRRADEGWVSLTDELQKLAQLGYGPASGPSDDWVRVCATRSNDNGSFELRGRELSAECALLASADGARPSELERIVLGSIDNELRLRATCSFSGRVLVADPEFLAVLTVCASREPLVLLTPSTRDASVVGVDRTGRFAFDDAPCGPIHVTASIDGQLAYDAGTVVPDELGGAEYVLDLRGRLFEHQVELVDEAAAPIGTGSLRWRDARSPDAPWLEALVVDGLAIVRTAAPAIDVEARVDARRIVASEDLAGSAKLVLPPACRLTAVLGDAFDLTEPGVHVELWVHPTGVLGERGHGRELRDERSAAFWLQEPGEWIVEWYLADDAKRLREPLAWSSVTVDEGTRELSTALEISPDEFARHRANLRTARDK